MSEENSTLREKASLEAQFSLIDAMAEDSQCQALIFLHETGNDLPRWSTYVYGYHSGGGGSGQLTGFGADKMEKCMKRSGAKAPRKERLRGLRRLRLGSR